MTRHRCHHGPWGCLLLVPWLVVITGRDGEGGPRAALTAAWNIRAPGVSAEVRGR